MLFIDLHGYDEAPVEPPQALDALLRALEVPADQIPPGTEARAGLYRSALAEIGEPVLVIADNASSEARSGRCCRARVRTGAGDLEAYAGRAGCPAGGCDGPRR